METITSIIANEILDKVTEIATESEVDDLGIENQLNDIDSKNIESVAANNERALETRNSILEGLKHQETGVPFIRQEIKKLDGTIKEGVFPEFDAVCEYYLPEELYSESDYRQSKYLIEKLQQDIEKNSDLKNMFSETQLEQIKAGDKPDGFTWHHHQEIGRMQLVDFEIHMKTGHTGGREIWGGGR